MPSYTSKWVASDGTTFLFNDPYGINAWDGDKFEQTIPTAASQGPGEYAEDAIPDARMVTITGTLRGNGVTEFQQRWQTLTGVLSKGIVGKLYKDSEHYLEGRCNGVERDKDVGLDWCQWTAYFRISEPLFKKETASSQNLVIGANVMTIGGKYKTPVIITLVVSSIGTGGKFTVTHTYGGYSESFTLTPTATGTYVIDATNGSIQRGIVDVDGEFSGCFFEEVEPTGSTITVAVSGGATLSGVTPSTVTWRPRFPGA